jgi:hypothetical protein
MYIKSNESLVGKTVILTKKLESMTGYFEIGSVVKITSEDPTRGYTFMDDEGNKVFEAGWTGFKVLSNSGE